MFPSEWNHSLAGCALAGMWSQEAEPELDPRHSDPWCRPPSLQLSHLSLRWHLITCSKLTQPVTPWHRHLCQLTVFTATLVKTPFPPRKLFSLKISWNWSFTFLFVGILPNPEEASEKSTFMDVLLILPAIYVSCGNIDSPQWACPGTWVLVGSHEIEVALLSCFLHPIMDTCLRSDLGWTVIPSQLWHFSAEASLWASCVQDHWCEGWQKARPTRQKNTCSSSSPSLVLLPWNFII